MPFKYTEEEKASFKDEIVARISLGETLRSICREEGKPDFRAVYRWRKDDADFEGRFAQARELGYDAIAEECLDIADNANNDWMEKQGENASVGWQLNGDHVQRDKMRIETRLKLLAKWSKKYGERVVNELVGKDDGAIQYETKSLTTEQIIELAKERGLPTSIFEK
jgi:hypothetical protein